MRDDEEAGTFGQFGVAATEHALQAETGALRQPVLDLLGPDERNVRVLRDHEIIAKPVIDLDPRLVAVESLDPHSLAGAGPQPVWIGELECQATIVCEVSRRTTKPLDAAENVRWHHHKGELPSKVQIFDARLNSFHAWQPGLKARQHAGVTVNADQLDSGPMQRDGQPASPNAQVEHGRLSSLCQLEPWPELGRIGEMGVELGKTGIRVQRIVADGPRSGYATASSAMESALSIMAKPSASSSSLMQSGGLVMMVCQRTKV